MDKMTREEREKAIDLLDNLLGMIEDTQGNDYDFALKKGIEALKHVPCEDEDMGEVSDGYHTFNQLYHQRAILFATIVNQNKDIAWKSYKHSDGKYCFDKNGEWFVVGIDTPEGSYTYHYQKEYWDYFDCKELPCGKVWDGHTEKDVTRLLSLKQEQCEDVVSRQAVIDIIKDWWEKGVIALGDIRELPSVTPTQKWIPVSEGLPKKSGWYLTTVKFDTGNGFITERLKDFFCDEPQAWANYGEDIIAWLPLPEPYNAEMESEE